jgi:heptosyltransferase III
VVDGHWLSGEIKTEGTDSPVILMSTLIYHTGALGDFITTIPAIRYYKKLNPCKPITLLGRPAIGKFAKDIDLITDWLDVDNPRLLPLFFDNFSDNAKKLLADFTTAILFTSPDAPIVKNIERSAVNKIFWQLPFPESSIHIIDYHLSLFCDPATVAESEKIPAIVPSTDAFSSIETLLPPDTKKPVAIHPGSGSKKKNWSFDRFLKIAGYFRSKQVPVLWIKGPAEDDYYFPADDAVASNFPLTELAAHLSKCRSYIGNDSGVTHLAAAVGCKTVALFGPSERRIWTPRGRDVIIISPEKTCPPCHRLPSTGSLCDHSCLNDISVDEVLYVFS